MSVARVPSQIAVVTMLGLWRLGGVANAQTCHVDAPRYGLREDTVSWTMTIEKGRSCVRGVRFANVQFNNLKLASPPQFGETAVQGAGFVYSPGPNYHGQDAFTLVVTGAINGKPGSSTIQIKVTDSFSNGISADTTAPLPATSSPALAPPAVAFTAPSEGSTVSGPDVVLNATASSNIGVASVQFVLRGEKILTGEMIGSAVKSQPYLIVWDSTAIADGPYTLYAVARDTAGNSESSWIHVTVKNK
jgi:hypothetical protein